MGFKTIFNFRLVTKQGADIEGETVAGKAAGINFVHLPLSGGSPDPAVADNFIKAITMPGAQSKTIDLDRAIAVASCHLCRPTTDEEQVFQGDLLVTTEKEDEESNRQQK